jgi:hypothetical protein
MLLLCLVLTCSVDDPPKAKDPADSPGRALERFAAATREGNIEKLADVLAKATRKTLDRRIVAVAEAARLEKEFEDALTAKFGMDEAPKQIPLATDSLSKDPDFAVKVLKEQTVDPGRVNMWVLSGRRLPSGEIDGREQEMHAVLENGVWRLEIPERVKTDQLLVFAYDFWADMAEQRKKVLAGLKDGKYASREAARSAWNNVKPDLTKFRGRPMTPPGPPLPVPGNKEFTLPAPARKPRGKVEFRKAEKLPGDGLVKMTVPGQEDPVYVHPKAELTTEDIDTAKVGIDINRDPVLEITFTQKGAEKMATLSKEHLGKPLAFLVEGKVVFAPKIMTKLSDRIIVTAKWSKAEVEQLARSINGRD